LGKKIVILAPYPIGHAPSQRFRFEQYFQILENNHFHFKIKTFYSLKTWRILHQEGNLFSKIARIKISFFLRLLHVFQSLSADFIFIHREASPIGPPIFEWILIKFFRKKVIYDFDDAIWLPNYSEANTRFQKLKYYSKVNSIIKWSWKISVGNQFLADYALQFNQNVIINPTTIDTENYHNPILFHENITPNKKAIIGWTGTHTTIKYLDFLVPILQKLNEEFDYTFCVISNEAPQLDLPNLQFIPWQKETEIKDLMQFDLGVMPLTNDDWSKGKCGFKSLQYMALKTPSIASPVGVNQQIIDHGINGFLCDSPEEWYESLKYFLQHPEEMESMKESARQKIEKYFSVHANTENFLNLFNTSI
jgi:glycosyltransferase involved in cell wall biosynthesis